MYQVVLKIKIPDHWVHSLPPEAREELRVLDCMPHGQEGGKSLFELTGDVDVEAVLREIEKNPNICRIELSKLEDGVVMGYVSTQKCVACKALTGSDCFLSEAKMLDDGWVLWSLLSDRTGSAADVISRLKKEGCEVELKKMTRLSRKNRMTARQEEVLKMAFRNGYYDYPKKVTIKDLANRLGVSPSTVAEILQRAEKKVIAEYFGEG